MWIFIRVSTNSYIKASARALGEATPGAPGAVRTRDPLLKRQVLIYQLSYRRIFAADIYNAACGVPHQSADWIILAFGFGRFNHRHQLQVGRYTTR